MAPRGLAHLTVAERRRALVKSSVRFLAIFLGVTAAYYLLPFASASSDLQAVASLLTGAVRFIVVMIWEVRRILRADLPELRSVEAIAVAVPFFLTIYAAAYVTLSGFSPGSFSQPLNRTGGLYYSIVTFGTVGYGDIAPSQRRCPDPRQHPDPGRPGLHRPRAASRVRRRTRHAGTAGSARRWRCAGGATQRRIVMGLKRLRSRPFEPTRFRAACRWSRDHPVAGVEPGSHEVKAIVGPGGRRGVGHPGCRQTGRNRAAGDPGDVDGAGGGATPVIRCAGGAGNQVPSATVGVG